MEMQIVRTGNALDRTHHCTQLTWALWQKLVTKCEVTAAACRITCSYVFWHVKKYHENKNSVVLRTENNALCSLFSSMNMYFHLITIFPVHADHFPNDSPPQNIVFIIWHNFSWTWAKHPVFFFVLLLAARGAVVVLGWGVWGVCGWGGLLDKPMLRFSYLVTEEHSCLISTQWSQV